MKKVCLTIVAMFFSSTSLFANLCNLQQLGQFDLFLKKQISDLSETAEQSTDECTKNTVKDYADQIRLMRMEYGGEVSSEESNACVTALTVCSDKTGAYLEYEMFFMSTKTVPHGCKLNQIWMLKKEECSSYFPAIEAGAFEDITK